MGALVYDEVLDANGAVDVDNSLLLQMGAVYGGTGEINGDLAYFGMLARAPLSSKLAVTWMIVIASIGQLIRADFEAAAVCCTPPMRLTPTILLARVPPRSFHARCPPRLLLASPSRACCSPQWSPQKAAKKRSLATKLEALRARVSLVLLLPLILVAVLAIFFVLLLALVASIQMIQLSAIWGALVACACRRCAA